MSIVEVRPCLPEDVSVVWTLILRLAEYEKLLDRVVGTEEALYRWLFDEPVIEVLVAELEGEVVGYALFFKNFSTFLARPGIWLEDLFVVPEHRGKGIGKKLISAVVDSARSRNFGRVEWSVLDWNQSAIEFYERIGADVLPDWRICRVRL